MIKFKYANQSNNPPIASSSSSTFGGYSFLAFLSSFLGYSFLVYLATSLAAGAEVVAAGALEADPKLKKFERLVPLTALANILGQYGSTLTFAALTKALILSAVTS